MAARLWKGSSRSGTPSRQTTAVSAAYGSLGNLSQSQSLDIVGNLIMSLTWNQQSIRGVTRLRGQWTQRLTNSLPTPPELLRRL